MTEKFSGLCIGGPMKGQCAVSQHQRLKVEERPPLKTLLVESIKEEPDHVVTTHEYTWHHTGGFGLWIYQGMNIHDAIEEMANSYAREHSK